MALPTVRSVGAVSSGTTITALGLPSGYQANDILVIVAETANENPSTNPPTGWTAAPNLPTGSGTAAAIGSVKLFVWWKRASASESTVNFGTTFNHCVARMMAIQGCPTSGDPWETSASTKQDTASTSLSFPSITTSGIDRLIVLAAAFDRDANTTANLPALTNTNLASITERMDNLVTTGVGGGIGCATANKATAGSTGTTTGTITSGIYHSWTGALLPASTAETIPVDTASYTVAVTNDHYVGDRGVPYFVSASTIGLSDATTTVATTVPSCFTDDLLLAVVTKDSNTTISAPAGWSQLDTRAESTTFRQSVFWRKATATNTPSGSQTFTFGAAGTSPNTGAAVIYVIRGIDTIEVTPFADTDGGTGNSASQTTPTFTGFAPKSRYLGFYIDSFSANVAGSPPAGYTEFNEQTAAAGGGIAIHAWGGTINTSAATSETVEFIPTTPGNCVHGSVANPWASLAIAIGSNYRQVIASKPAVTVTTYDITIPGPPTVVTIDAPASIAVTTQQAFMKTIVAVDTQSVAVTTKIASGAVFRFEADDGAVESATILAPQGVAYPIKNGNNFRIRFGVQAESAVSAGSLSAYCRVNGGAWFQPTNATPIQFALSSNEAQNAATSQKITLGSFVAGRFEEDNGQVSTFAMSAGQVSEYVFNFKVDTAQVTAQDTLYFDFIGAPAGMAYSQVVTQYLPTQTIQVDTRSFAITTLTPTISEVVRITAPATVSIANQSATVLVTEKINVDSASFTITANAVETRSKAFPSVLAQTTGYTDGTSHAITLPSAAANQLLLVVFTTENGATASASGWSKVGQNTNVTITQAVFYKVASGSDSLTITTSTAEPATYIAYAIANANRVDSYDTSIGGQGSATTTGTSTNSPDPIAARPGNGLQGAIDTLWFATVGWPTLNPASSAPTGYTQLTSSLGPNVGWDGCTSVAAQKLAFGTTSNENPSTFSFGSSAGYVSYTLSVFAEPITITAAPTITVTTQSADVLESYDVFVNTANIAVTTYDALAVSAQYIAVDAAAIAVTTQAATVRETIHVDASSIALTTQEPKVNDSLRPSAAAIIITPAVVTLIADDIVPIDALSVVVIANDVIITSAAWVFVDLATLAINTLQANTKADYRVAVDTTSIAVTTVDPKVNATTNIDTDAAALAVTTQAVRVNESVIPTTATIAVTLNAVIAAETISVPVASVAVTTYPITALGTERVDVDQGIIEVRMLDTIGPTIIDEPFPIFINPRVLNVLVLVDVPVTNTPSYSLTTQDVTIVNPALFDMDLLGFIQAFPVPNVYEDYNSFVGAQSVAISTNDVIVIADAIIPDTESIAVTTNEARLVNTVPISSATYSLTTKDPQIQSKDVIGVVPAYFILTTQTPTLSFEQTPGVKGRTTGTRVSTTVHSIVLPANIEQNDLLMIGFFVDGEPTITWDNTSAGTWTGPYHVITNYPSTAVTAKYYYKVANGTESGVTIQPTTNTSVASAYVLYQVVGQEIGVLPSFTGGSLASASTIPSGYGAGWNPPWENRQTLVLSFGAYDNGGAIDASLGAVVPPYTGFTTVEPGTAFGVATSYRRFDGNGEPTRPEYPLTGGSVPVMYTAIAIKSGNAPEVIAIDTATISVTPIRTNEVERLAVDTRSFAVTTQDANPIISIRQIVDNTLAYAVTTFNANINARFVDRVGTWTIAVTTRDPQLNSKDIIYVDTASIAVTTNVAFTKDDTLISVDAASIVVVTSAANTKADYNVPVDTRGFTTATFAAIINERWVEPVSTANVTITTNAINTNARERIPVDKATYALTTSPAVINARVVLPVDNTESVVVTTSPAVINERYVVPVNNTAALTVTAYEAGVTGDIDIPVLNTETIVVTPILPAINAAFVVPVDTRSFAITPRNPNIKANYIETMTTATIVVTTFAMESYLNVKVPVDKQTYVFTQQYPGVNEKRKVEVDTRSFTVTTNDPNIAEDYNVVVDTAAITITTNDVTLIEETTTSPTAAAITVATQDPIVNAAFVVPVDTAAVNTVTFPAIINEREFIAVLLDDIDITTYDVSFIEPYLAHVVTATTYKWVLEDEYHGSTVVRGTAVKTPTTTAPTSLRLKKQSEWIKPIIKAGP